MTFYKYTLLFLFFVSAQVGAEFFLQASPAWITIDTPSATVHPVVADLRLGYARKDHQFELALMPKLKEDDENQLSIEVPAAVSFFYHYVPHTPHSLKFHLITGFSVIKVDSDYPAVSSSSDQFHGVSYGIGFEESFKSMPQLKLSFDWIQLYRGDQLNINATSFGVHYEF